MGSGPGPVVLLYPPPPPLFSPFPTLITPPRIGPFCFSPRPRPQSSRSPTPQSQRKRAAKAAMLSSSSPSPSDPPSPPDLPFKDFLASLMPKKEIAADRFLQAHPSFDGRGVLIAIFDSGVDPAAAGLQLTSDGKPKLIDVLDCTGSGDVDTSKIVKADQHGCIVAASGAKLLLNPSWTNPSQEWHVGCKLVYELFTDTLTSRLKKERKKKWDEDNQEAISQALKELNQFDKDHSKVEDVKVKKAREDLQYKLDFLRNQADSYDDRGPVIDVVVWNDGEVWRVAVDTQSLEDSPDKGKLADFSPLTNYRLERKYGIFSKLDACSFVTNVYDEGNVVSIVTDCSSHATHVAGITAAYHPEEPLLNGVAPGAQLISCKIGDSRLGSMETGTGLTRALIAAVEHKCDLINMSYGEPTLLPDYGRFIDLASEVVDKHRLIFVSSAGNSGPALTTVGAPGGTSSSIIGVGAYVSPAMAAGAHSVVEPPSDGLEYTWSSRGPTADGDLGVSISAPGGAVAPVPTWTLQRRQLMNGTSMASPCACGGIALLVSAMKAEGIEVSPYSVRKAVENSALSVSIVPEETLTSGQGLLQVDSAYKYIQQARDLPAISYQVQLTQVGKTTPTVRGIYLREYTACLQSSEWTVQVQPKFHEGASNLDELVPFEECIKLQSSDESVVQVPEYLLLTNNGRTFTIVVDPTKVGDGLHYYEAYGTDAKAPWRGPLFRIPITIIKPASPIGQPPTFSLSNLSFYPGHIERRFINVPIGASWVEVTMRTYGFDTPRRFFLDTLQICPLKRPMKWESVVTFPSPSVKCFTFAVQGGLTLELAIAQFWSSGMGSHEATTVDFEIMFHGISTSQAAIALDGSEAPAQIVVTSLLAAEKLVPSACLDKVRIPYRPVDTKLNHLSGSRDKLPSGKQIIALTLTYKFKLEDGASIKPSIPLLNNRIYDNKFESQFYIIVDPNKRVYSSGDVYPNFVSIPKGQYTLYLYIRHENIQFLEKLKQLVLFIERKLEKKIQLSFFSEPDGPITGGGNFKSSVLVPGEPEAFYVALPTKDNIPKSTPAGSFLVGSMSYGMVTLNSKSDDQNNQQSPASYDISCLVPPSKVHEDKGKGSTTTKKSAAERLAEEVRDTKIGFLSSLKRHTEEEKSTWHKITAALKSEYPKYTPMLAKILEGLLSGATDDDKYAHYQEVIAAADEVIESIDKEELAKSLSLKPDPDDEEAQEHKKKMEAARDHLAEALYQKGLALAEIESLKPEKSPEPEEGGDDITKSSEKSDKFEENYKELIKWVDITLNKYSMLLVTRERRHGRLGTALKVLNDRLQDDSEATKRTLYDLKIEMIDEIGWSHVAAYERQWMHVRFPAALPLF